VVGQTNIVEQMLSIAHYAIKNWVVMTAGNTMTLRANGERAKQSGIDRQWVVFPSPTNAERVNFCMREFILRHASVSLIEELLRNR